MRNPLRYLLLFVTLLFANWHQAKAQYVYIPDSAFRAFLNINYFPCMNGDSLNINCPSVVNETKLFVSNLDIKDLSGIQYFISLDTLYCEYNKLTALPILPSSLGYLYCGNNKITSISALPPSLKHLVCGFNQITAISSLPSSLLSLNCFFNLLTSLPSLPNNLQALIVSANRLTSLPTLPPSLLDLSCDSNQIACFPTLPNNLYYVYAGANPATCFPNKPDSLLFSTPYVLPICQIGNLYNCNVFSRITGKVFVDANSNNIQDASENGIAGFGITDMTNGYIFFTDSLGKYEAIHDTGSFAITPYFSTPLPYWNFVPGIYQGNFTSYNQIDSLNNFALQPIGNVKDLQINLIADRPFARPVQPINYTLDYRNIGNTNAGDSVVFVYDTQQTFISAIPTPNSHIGNRLKWNISPLSPFQSQQISASFVVDTFAPLFSNLYNQATIYPLVGDTTPLDNQYNHQIGVRNSYDPNAKVSNPANLSPAQVASGEPLVYTIHFQNLGTAEAIDVRITDTLSTKFNFNSFEIVGSSHSNYKFSLINRVAKWDFIGINLPDSATNEPASHGWVAFKIKPLSGLNIGDSLLNTASIYFDYNPVVRTNNAVCRVLEPSAIVSPSDAPTLWVYPNPSKGSFNVTTTVAEAGLVTYEVLNLTGQQVYKTALQANAGTFSTSVTLNQQTAGLYTLVLTSPQGRAYRKLLITQ